MQQVLGCSVSYRIAVGPQQGRKVFTLQTIPVWEDDDRFAQVAKESGFSLHAGVAAQAWERQKLERLARYITRPAVSEKRLSLTSSGNIRYQLKTPYSDGTTHVIFEPLDCMSHIHVLHPAGDLRSCKSAILPICHCQAGGAGAETPSEPDPVPHGVFAPNSKYRVDVTPTKRGKGCARQENEDKTPEQRHKAMTWAQRLKRVFNIDVSVCPKCGGETKVIASIEDKSIIDKILNHLLGKGALPPPPGLLSATRASPDTGWFA
jgi:hypothetical protein